MFCNSLKMYFFRVIEKLRMHVKNTLNEVLRSVVWRLNHTMT